MPKTLHFLHIGKTGGSAIKDSLKAGIKKQDRYNNEKAIRNNKPYNIRDLSREYDRIVFHGHGSTLKNIPDSDFFFFCIRNPIKRYISGFNSRLNQGKPKYNCPWSNEERIAFSHFQTPNELAESLSSKDTQHKDAATKAIQNIRHVKDPMLSWFDNYEYLLKRSKHLISICDQKNLLNDYNGLLSRLRINEEFKEPASLKAVHVSSLASSNQLSSIAIKNLNLYYADEICFYHKLLGLRENINHRNAY